MTADQLQSLYAVYQSIHPRLASVEAEFCEIAEMFFESQDLKSENYEVQICRLHEHCEEKIESGLIAKAVGCSESYARRFSYEPERGGFQKDWSKSNQNEKVSPGARTKIIRRDGGCCLRCGTSEDLEVHHIQPISQGGTNDDANLATLCVSCHHSAHGGSKTSGEIVYQKEEFTNWLNEVEQDNSNIGHNLSAEQKKISDY